MKIFVGVLFVASLLCHIEAKCIIQTSLPNGRVECKGSGEPGSICTFWCNSGFERKGPARIECAKTWNAEPPTCEPVCEPMPDAPENGYKTCQGCGSLGTSCTFDCKPGFELKGSESTSCVRKGSKADWSHPTPACIKVDVKCKDQVTEGLIFKCDNPVHGEGTVCTYECEEPGFELIPSAENKTECVEVGIDDNGNPILNWTISPPCCVDCSKIKQDIVIAIDSSDSLSQQDWVLMNKFVSNVVGKFNVSPDGVKFAIYQFSSSYKPLDPFQRGKDFFGLSAEEIKKKLKAKSWKKMSQGTRTGGALKIAQKYFLKPGERGNRAEVPDMVWVFTDGEAEDQDVLKKVSKQIRASGAQIFALAIGDYDKFMNQMVEMTGSSDKVLKGDDFSELTDELVELVSTKICEETCHEDIVVSISTK